MEQYNKYKNFFEDEVDFPTEIKGLAKKINQNWKIKFFKIDFKLQTNLSFVRIFFDTPTFDRVTKDNAAKFSNILAAVGGTMGLLTGFSIISLVEIIYFALKIILNITREK